MKAIFSLVFLTIYSLSSHAVNNLGVGFKVDLPDHFSIEMNAFDNTEAATRYLAQPQGKEKLGTIVVVDISDDDFITNLTKIVDPGMGPISILPIDYSEVRSPDSKSRLEKNENSTPKSIVAGYLSAGIGTVGFLVSGDLDKIEKGASIAVEALLQYAFVYNKFGWLKFLRKNSVRASYFLTTKYNEMSKRKHENPELITIFNSHVPDTPPKPIQFTQYKKLKTMAQTLINFSTRTTGDFFFIVSTHLSNLDFVLSHKLFLALGPAAATSLGSSGFETGILKAQEKNVINKKQTEMLLLIRDVVSTAIFTALYIYGGGENIIAQIATASAIAYSLTGVATARWGSQMIKFVLKVPALNGFLNIVDYGISWTADNLIKYGIINNSKCSKMIVNSQF